MYQVKHKAFSERTEHFCRISIFVCERLCVCAQKSTICALSLGFCCFCYSSFRFNESRLTAIRILFMQAQIYFSLIPSSRSFVVFAECEMWTCMCKFKLKDSMEYDDDDDEDLSIDIIMIIIFRGTQLAFTYLYIGLWTQKFIALSFFTPVCLLGRRSLCFCFSFASDEIDTVVLILPMYTTLAPSALFFWTNGRRMKHLTCVHLLLVDFSLPAQTPFIFCPLLECHSTD